MTQGVDETGTPVVMPDGTLADDEGEEMILDLLGPPPSDE